VVAVVVPVVEVAEAAYLYFRRKETFRHDCDLPVIWRQNIGLD
jgi:hypothetical protein